MNRRRCSPGSQWKSRVHLSIILAFLVSCAAQQSAEPQSKGAELTSAPGSQDAAQPPHPGQAMPYPQPFGTQTPFALPAPGDLTGNEAALDVYERELTVALDPNSPVQLTEGDRCAIVCRALQSMRQSAQHICGLAQDRCESARERVRKAEARAKDACPACATPT